MGPKGSPPLVIQGPSASPTRLGVRPQHTGKGGLPSAQALATQRGGQRTGVCKEGLCLGNLLEAL